MEKTEEAKNRITTFRKMSEEVVAANLNAYRRVGSYFAARPHTSYTKEEALDIIHGGDPNQLQKLSLSFFYTSGFYRRMLLYYSTILTYSTLVIPNSKNRDLTDVELKKYNKALDLIENLNPQILGVQIALRVFVEGAYYGMLSKSSQGLFTLINLPFCYCRHRYKTYEGIDIVEFNLQFFDTITDKNQRINCLKTYPDEIRLAYNSYKNRGTSYWYQVPAGYGVHFSIYEDRPLLADTIPAIIDFGEYRELEKEKDKQQLKSILVQEMPHLNDGELVFEPEEALEMHKGVVNMLANTDGIDVLTSFGDVDVKDLQSTRGVITNNLEKIENSIYSEAGVSKQLFSANTTTSLNKAVENDCALAMIFGTSFANWLKFLLNMEYGSNSFTFDVVMLPISYYNRSEMFKTSLQAAQNGFSIFIPALALGISQKQLINLKQLENSLNLLDYMKPLSSSYTQTGSDIKSSTSREDGKLKADITNENNNNQKSETEKTDETLRVENSGGNE